MYCVNQLPFFWLNLLDHIYLTNIRLISWLKKYCLLFRCFATWNLERLSPCNVCYCIILPVLNKNRITFHYILFQVNIQVEQKKMQIGVNIDEKKMILKIGKGYNDWVWLAHYAARAYSSSSYPQGVYIPTFLYLISDGQQLHPHPRQKIFSYIEQNRLSIKTLEVVVKIKKSNYTYTDAQIKWQKKAFGSERYLMDVNVLYQAMKINRKKDFFFKVNQDVKPYFLGKKYPPIMEVRLQQEIIDQDSSKFTTNLKLPLGTISEKLFYCQKQAGQEYRQIQLTQNQIKKGDFKVKKQPKYISNESINILVQEDMKISQNVQKAMQQKQMQAKKRNASSSLCCYTFEQFWKIIELNHSDELYLDSYESNTKQRVKIILQKYLSELYEVFFYYFIVENQQKDKKEDLGIVYQHVMHFLRDYQVIPQMSALMSFIEFYNSDEKFKRFEDTVDIDKHPVKFPQFIVILLRAVQFVQASTFMMKGETFDITVNKVVERIVEIDNQQDEFSEFRRNIRQNPKIISFVRNNAESIKQIFIYQAVNSMQNSSNSYVIMKEQLKLMLECSQLTTKNTDKILQDCYMQLKFNESGIFYYQFLEILQWLALAIVSYEKQEAKGLENQEQQALLLIEKIKFLLEKLKV